MADKNISFNQQEEQAQELEKLQQRLTLHDPTTGAASIFNVSLLKGKRGMEAIKKKGEQPQGKGYYEMNGYRYQPIGEKGGILAKKTAQLTVAVQYNNLDVIKGSNIGTAKISDIFFSKAFSAPIDKKTGKLQDGKNYWIDIPAEDYAKWGIYPDRGSAIRGFKTAARALTQATIIVEGQGKKTDFQNEEGAVLFVAWKVENNVTSLAMNGEANWHTTCAHYIDVSTSMLNLSKSSYALVKRLLEHAKTNKSRITAAGWLPPISIKRAIEWAEIDTSHPERLKDCEYEINHMPALAMEIRLEYEKSSKGKDIARRGELYCRIYGAMLDSLVNMADKQEDMRELTKARRKKKVANAQKEAAEAKLEALNAQKALEAAQTAEEGK